MEVIHGSHAALEMPRERLKANSRQSIRINWVALSSTKPESGTKAITNIMATRVPQPAYTNRL